MSKKLGWVVFGLLSLFATSGAQAAIAVRGSSTAYFQSSTLFSSSGSAPTIVGVGTAISAASGNVTPPLPTGIVAGNLLLCIVESHDNVQPTLPTGWTRLYRNRPGTEYSTAWYKVATAVETSPLITHSAGGSIIAQCAAYSGASSAAPKVSLLAGTGAKVTSGSITTTLANELLLMAAHLNQGATTTTGWSMSTPSGLTWTPRFASTTTLGLGSSIGLFDATKATAGLQAAATATIAGTVNGASLNYGALIDLKPAVIINKPTGTVSGDLMVLAIAARSSTATITPPVGWTLLLNTTNGTKTTSKLSTYYKIAGASEPASYIWGTGTIESVASLVSFSGVDNTSPFDGVAAVGFANTSATTTQTAPSITPLSANDTLVTVHELTSTPCATGRINGWIPPTGMTEQTDVCSRAAKSTSGMGMEINTLALTSATATGTKTATAAANKARGVSQSMVLRPATLIALDHIEIDYPAPPFSTCAPTAVTVKACADTACNSLYTQGTSVTLSPGGNVVTIPALSSSGSGTVFQTSAGTASLSTDASSTTCKNTATGAIGCSVNFSATSLTVTLANFTSGNTVTGTISACTAQLPAGTNSISFYTTYQNPASGTKTATINGTTLSTGTPGTGINLTFNGASPSSSASFSLSYPDVGALGLTAVKGSASGNTSFIATPHHFALSNIKCGNGTTYTGCSVTTPYNNPSATDAAGAAFMKAGNPFSMTVTSYNSAGAITPNFGKETPAEGVNLTPAAAMADLSSAVTGVLTGSFGSFSGGVATGTAFSYDEVGIMTLTPSLLDPDAKGYMSIGNQTLNPSGTISGNIGRFIPDHFILKPDPDSPILTRADLLQTSAIVNVPAVAGSTTLSVDQTLGFFVGDKVRIPGAGAAGVALIAAITAVDSNALTITLNTGIGLDLVGDGTEKVFAEWGSYMGEQMDAQFTLNAVELAGTTTNNYQGNYAKLDPAASGNPLGLGAMNDGTVKSYNLPLDTSLTATDSSGSNPASFVSGSATIAAPFAIVRGASPTGPYSAITVGIAPTDTDGVKMGGTDIYDLGISSATPDHTSIMDPLVQSTTQVRYGRSRISNGYGSGLAPLSLPIAAEYWDGQLYVTNGDDDLSSLTFGLVNFQGNLQAGETIMTASAIAAGLGQVNLSAPGFGNEGSVDVSITAPTYLPKVANGRATFGVASGKHNFIYRGRRGR